MLSGKRITLLVTGSIAAYKSAELVRELIKSGNEVRVVMSRGAREFITPLTLQTLSGHQVTTELFDLSQESEIGHIQLADDADVVVVAPASANLIARAANGMADDACTAVLLATKAPIVMAPAMNVNMWENPLTQQNVAKLAAIGVQFVTPGEGELACGWHGPGRLADLSQLMDAIAAATYPKNMRGMRVLVAAGPTREDLDPVRYISNHSSGKMGYALARAARFRGADVTLVSGPTHLSAPEGVKTIRVTNAVEMREQIFSTLPSLTKDEGHCLVFMVAAVSDHRPAEVSAKKLKLDKASDQVLKLTPNPDILAELGKRRGEFEKKAQLKIIGFAAETGDVSELVDSARDKLTRKKADLIVGNFAGEAFGGETNRVWLIDRERAEEVAAAKKIVIADRIINAALRG